MMQYSRSIFYHRHLKASFLSYQTLRGMSRPIPSYPSNPNCLGGELIVVKTFAVSKSYQLHNWQLYTGSRPWEIQLSNKPFVAPEVLTRVICLLCEWGADLTFFWFGKVAFFYMPEEQASTVMLPNNAHKLKCTFRPARIGFGKCNNLTLINSSNLLFFPLPSL